VGKNIVYQKLNINKRKNMSKKSIAVLCRGKSLSHIDKLPDIDLYVIVNRFGKELNTENVKNKLSDKEIHHVMSRVPEEPASMVANDHYSKFNISRLVQPYTRHMGNPFEIGNGWMYKMFGDKMYFVGHRDGRENKIPATILGDNHIEHMHDYQKRYPHHYPSCGNAAFGYAVLDTDSTDIHLIGMDFYENKKEMYYADDPTPAGFSGEDTPKMKESVFNLIEKFPDKNFFIYSFANISTKLKNCKIIKLEK
tara:strand:- start:240 stop:995 length:756 start_codon:yes stop_codon:yes gene_type:complete